MNETIKVLTQRRSVRGYTDKQPSQAELAQILEAGKYAATGKGAQDTLFVLVQNKEVISKLSAMNAKVMGATNDPFYGAKTVIIVFADRNHFTHVEDGSLAMGNLMNAAYALGIDSCWINRAKEVFETPEGRALATKWGVPESYIGIGNCILGYHSGEYPTPKARKDNFVIEVR